MDLTPEELRLVLQWFSGVEDLAPETLGEADRDLAARIKLAVVDALEQEIAVLGRRNGPE
jgi:hypothetical protein